ncbi:hypothetical protein COW49_01005 [Candidatus Kaiserbacteria bacterium CG17_big_fil_post_rev_8_21_14_2_50_51_7]|uniref:Uncharacterized protein n=1 Tax=Candidatus Kaiserbacteria bacterium CG17_big_fil_post_rev_8_21_14_2_50_51_7 TaxID=1974613 RepID=A0A2M7FE76_9BACT|nr:MAG: hypothetical protein COW49_01005 [Candidatus Kaiserbacteria bacterium CG17_big_fil_post_rev_8_21_14_2_50_51_7]
MAAITDKKRNDLNRMAPAAWKVQLGTIIDLLADQLGYPSISIETEGTNTIDVTIQMKDAKADNLAGVFRMDFTVSDAAAGAPTTDPPSGGVTATTGILFGFASGVSYLEVTPDTVGWIQTDSTGKAVIRFTETGTDTFYLNLVKGNKTYSSGAITFAA